MGEMGLFVGLCNLDIIYYSDTDMPGDNCKKKIRDYRMAVGGPAANAAITYSMLGGKAFLFAAIGNSPMGLLVKQMLLERGVQVMDAAETGAECNISCIHVNTVSGDRTILSGQHGCVVAQEGMDSLPALIEKCAFVLYDGNLPGVEKALTGLVDRHRKELVLDAGSYKPGFSYCFEAGPTVISSESFADEEGRDVFSLHERYGFQGCARTRGGASVQYLEDGVLCEIPVRSAMVVDTLGAGDVFHGAYCYFKYCQKLTFQNALAQAAGFASYTVERRGVAEGIKYAILSHTTNTLR